MLCHSLIYWCVQTEWTVNVPFASIITSTDSSTEKAQHSIVISSFQGRPSTEKVVDKVEYTTFFSDGFYFYKKKTFYLEICLVDTKHCMY